MTDVTPSRAELWSMVHSERASLAADLAGLTQEQWAAPSLCEGWGVREVVAHLTAAASSGFPRWLWSMAAARFDPSVHNARRLREHLGDSPAETLERFRAVQRSTRAPSRDTAAWLGEVVVHGQDIRRPLGLGTEAPADVVTPVLEFFVARDFAVNSKSAARGLRLEATDGAFTHGDGPLVRGTTLALTMALAGRTAYCAELTGAGADLLAERGGSDGDADEEP